MGLLQSLFCTTYEFQRTPFGPWSGDETILISSESNLHQVIPTTLLTKESDLKSWAKDDLHIAAEWPKIHKSKFSIKSSWGVLYHTNLYECSSHKTLLQ